MEFNSTGPHHRRAATSNSTFQTGRVTLGLAATWISMLASLGIAHATTTNETLFCDEFAASNHSSPASPWRTQAGNWTVLDQQFCGEPNNLFSYSFICVETNWTDYSVQGRIKFPVNAYGGGLGGRLDAATGAHYAAWIYPENSVGGSNLLRLVKFTNWGNWTLLQQVRVASVGTNAHTLKLSFVGNRITASLDGFEVASVTDNSLIAGGITADMWTHDIPYVLNLDDVLVTSLAQNPPNPLSTAPALTINTIEKLTDGNMRLVASGSPGQIYRLQTTSDLGNAAWSNLATNTANGSGVVEFQDRSATNYPSRFYRIFTP